MKELGEFQASDWLQQADDDPSLLAARCDLALKNLDGLLAWSQYNWHRQEPSARG